MPGAIIACGLRTARTLRNRKHAAMSALIARINLQALEHQTGGNKMSKVLRVAIITAILSAVTAPAFAADPPKSKAECAKLSDMKWDSKTKTCVKK